MVTLEPTLAVRTSFREYSSPSLETHEKKRLFSLFQQAGYDGRTCPSTFSWGAASGAPGTCYWIVTQSAPCHKQKQTEQHEDLKGVAIYIRMVISTWKAKAARPGAAFL